MKVSLRILVATERLLRHRTEQLTNPELRRRVSALGAGLIKVAGLVPEDSNVLLLLNDGLGTLHTHTRAQA